MQEQIAASKMLEGLPGEHEASTALLDGSSDPLLIDSEEKKLRIFTNICSRDLEASKAFYTELLGLEVKYDSDWFVQLGSPTDPSLEFGLIRQDHELVPNTYRNDPNGMYITFVVPDVDASYVRAVGLGAEIIQEPKNEFYGQRRFLVKEPSGCLVDICSPWEEPEVAATTESEPSSTKTTRAEAATLEEQELAEA